jgi:hypothetical protein
MYSGVQSRASCAGCSCGPEHAFQRDMARPARATHPDDVDPPMPIASTTAQDLALEFESEHDRSRAGRGVLVGLLISVPIWMAAYLILL